MAYEKFKLNFTIIDQIVYEMITNQFTLIQVTVPITHFCASTVYIIREIYYTDAPILQILFTIDFFLLILKTWLLKKNWLYI